MKVLVTGGAGYIGSFMAKKLIDSGNEVVIVDSLERGSENKIDKRAVFKKGNLLDEMFVNSLFDNTNYDCVMHFAAYIAVEESTKSPGMYFKNNLLSTINLLDQMVKYKLNNFIFSSTGTVYGTPSIIPTPESHPKNPENPYAESKLMVEKTLHWYYKAYGIGYSVLRYFNAAGGALDGSNGESHDPETHLIPAAINAAIQNIEFSLYGEDYKTRDGSAIRDYIHVLDLIDAHMLTVQKLQNKSGEYIYNVGTSRGWTNKEILSMIKKVSGSNFPIIIKSRREGDVAETVADTTKIKIELGFSPKYSDLETIVKTAWQWHTKKQG